MRIVPKETLLKGERYVDVYFYTSNVDKFMQAYLVFQKHGINLKHFETKQEPYSEDYSSDKENLLRKAIDELSRQLPSSRIYFIEDTSLRIDALSDQKDYPGLKVKEWFERTTFQDLDNEIRGRENNRKATIKSDIALKIPNLTTPIYFHGEVTGRVADTMPQFEENRLHPWLTPNNFNGWFIPDGGNCTLGEMSFEESIGYDFRIRAILNLINRIEEYAIFLNLPQNYYQRRQFLPTNSQLTLFKGEQQPSFVIVGKTCSGKTTFGDYAAHKHQLFSIEASSIVSLIQEQVNEKNLSKAEFAKKILNENGYDFIAKKILELYYDSMTKGFVITGFRTIEELELIKKEFPQTKVILVESLERVRFQRNLKRNRVENASTLTKFRSIDSQQWEYGLLKIAEYFADIKIMNGGKLEDYLGKIDLIIKNAPLIKIHGISQALSKTVAANKDQIYRSLLALVRLGRPSDSQEIALAVSKNGNKILPNNVNKVLKKIPELARRIENPHKKVMYEILPPGRAYLNLSNLNQL